MRTHRRPSRWWMAAVPVAVATMLAANGFRVENFWYYSGQHHEIAQGVAGTWVAVAEKTSDAHGDLTRAYDVRLAGLGGEQAAYLKGYSDEFDLRDGMVARTVNLDFRADPSTPLKNCVLTLVDTEGRTYRIGHVFDDLGERANACVPEKTPGPSMPVLITDQRGALPKDEQPRPAEWSTAPTIAVPKDAQFVELRVSFAEPDYVTLPLKR